MLRYARSGLPRVRARLSYALHTMKKKLFYRGPEPSHGMRPIPWRSKRSLRGSMVALLPGFARPRIIKFESNLEYLFLCLMLVRDDVFCIQEQPAAIHYLDTDGKSAKHNFDFLVTLFQSCPHS
ncbi:hypothetical protein [Thioclava sp. GXIMD4216]|uniref:hypothetical protein n=1 Tax=Thioclava sp. GXIMD4216 TaxID=3131929 RepID=UPI0030D42981